jgi:hypothetical protein
MHKKGQKLEKNTRWNSRVEEQLIDPSVTSPKCILVHYGFHKILNEIDQPLSEWGLIVMDNELFH